MTLEAERDELVHRCELRARLIRVLWGRQLPGFQGQEWTTPYAYDAFEVTDEESLELAGILGERP